MRHLTYENVFVSVQNAQKKRGTRTGNKPDKKSAPQVQAHTNLGGPVGPTSYVSATEGTSAALIKVSSLWSSGLSL